MEKKKAHFQLERVRSLIRNGDYQVTRTALRCATRDFGFVKASQLAACILELDETDFYKSMTTLYDTSRWQDVYRPSIDGCPAYVKLQIVDDNSVVISFKALEDGY